MLFVTISFQFSPLAPIWSIGQLQYVCLHTYTHLITVYFGTSPFHVATIRECSAWPARSFVPRSWVQLRSVSGKSSNEPIGTVLLPEC